MKKIREVKQMRSIDTSTIVDRNQTRLLRLYEARLGHDLTELTGADLSSSMRAVMELRLFHLPPYRRIPTPIKNLLSSQSYFPSINQHAVIVEREITLPGSLYFSGYAPRATCPICNTTNTRLVDGKCPTCTAPGDPRTQRKLFQLARQPSTPSYPSPKTAFMAAEYGCSICRRTVPFDWDSDPSLLDWVEGVCPDCNAQQTRHVHSEWASQITASIDPSIPRYYLVTTPQYQHQSCAQCGTTQYPYAFWGMCQQCYARFQDRYLNVSVIERVTYGIGPLALLLVRSDIEWLKYLAQGTVPRHRRAWSPPDVTLQEMRLPNKINRKITSAKDINVNIEELLLK